MKFVIHNVNCLILIQWKSSFILFQVKEEEDEDEEEKKEYVNIAKPITSCFVIVILFFLTTYTALLGLSDVMKGFNAL